jgi:hypothetical protein
LLTVGVAVTVGLDVEVRDAVGVPLLVGVLVMTGVGLLVGATGVVGVVVLEGQPVIKKVKPARREKSPKIRNFICFLPQRFRGIERCSSVGIDDEEFNGGDRPKQRNKVFRNHITIETLPARVGSFPKSYGHLDSADPFEGNETGGRFIINGFTTHLGA